jgi:hypothetical protein
MPEKKEPSTARFEGFDMMIIVLSAIGLAVCGLCYCIEVANRERASNRLSSTDNPFE